MINTETSKAVYTTTDDKSAAYPVPFEFFETPLQDKPELLVTLDGKELSYFDDYSLTEAGLVLAKAEPGKKLVITRDVSFTQEQDYTVGLINPEEIEEGFDRSVMRDQELRSNIVDLGTVTIEMQEEIEEVRSIAETADATAVSAETTARAASATATAADAKAQQALDQVGSYDARITEAKTTADRAKTAADEAKADAEEAMSAAQQAQRTANGADALARAAGSEASIAQRDVNNIARKIPENASETNKLATMADVQAGGKVQSVNGQQGVVVLTGEDIVATVDGQQDTIQGHIQTVSDEIDSVSQQVSGKQDTLVSGTNIKTINGESVLGEGNIEIQGGGSGIEWAASWDMPADWTGWAYPTYKTVHLPDGEYKMYYLVRYYHTQLTSVPTIHCAIFTVSGGRVIGGSAAPVLDGNTFPGVNYHYLLIGNSGYFNVGFGAETGDTYFYSSSWNYWGSDIGDYTQDHGAIENCFKISVIENTKTGEKYTPQLVGVSQEGGQALISEPLTGDNIVEYQGRDIPTVNIGTKSPQQSLYSYANAIQLYIGPSAFWTPGCDEEQLLNNHFWETDFGEVGIVITALSSDNQIIGSFNAKVSFGFGVLEQEISSRTGLFAASKAFLYTYSPEDAPVPYYYFCIATENGEPFSESECNYQYFITRMSSGNSLSSIYSYPANVDKPMFRDVIRVVTPGSGGGAVDSVNGKTGAVVLNAEDVQAVAQDQGAVNVGKFLKVGADGQVFASSESAGGGLTSVAHDETLAGAGTDADPLRVVGGGGDYLPLSGGTMRGPIEFTTIGGNLSLSGSYWGAMYGNLLNVDGSVKAATILGYHLSHGSGNGNLLSIPDKSGTIATTQDIADAVAEKQNKLVAGANITIDESTNTISATGGGTGGTIVIIKDL